MNVRKMALCALMAVVTALSAVLRFPLPGTEIMLSMQLVATLLSGLLLGSVGGAVSQLLYMALGLIGLPVFVGGGGIGYVATPSFCYLVGFVAAAFVAGLGKGGSLGRRLFCSLLGVVMLYVTALPLLALWKAVFFHAPVPFLTLLTAYCLTFLPLDAGKAVLAALLCARLSRAVKGNR